MIKRLHHIGIAVKDLNASLRVWRDNLRLEVDKVEVLEEEGIEIAHLKTPDGVFIELIASISPRSAIGKFIAKKGEGLHHLCFEVEDICQFEKELEQKGVSFLPGYPRSGSGQTIIAFLHPQSCSGVLVEVAQKKEK